MQGPTASDESCSWHERLTSDRTLPLGTQVVECLDYLGVIPRIAGWGLLGNGDEPSIARGRDGDRRNARLGLFGALPSTAFYPYHGAEMGASR
jgi:hypothetical protein